jgi:hypothetical protein
MVIASKLGTLSVADLALNLGKPVAPIKSTGDVADLPVEIMIDGRRIIPAASAPRRKTSVVGDQKQVDR